MSGHNSLWNKKFSQIITGLFSSEKIEVLDSFLPFFYTWLTNVWEPSIGQSMQLIIWIHLEDFFSTTLVKKKKMFENLKPLKVMFYNNLHGKIVVHHCFTMQGSHSKHTSWFEWKNSGSTTSKQCHATVSSYWINKFHLFLVLWITTNGRSTEYFRGWLWHLSGIMQGLHEKKELLIKENVERNHLTIIWGTFLSILTDTLEKFTPHGLSKRRHKYCFQTSPHKEWPKNRFFWCSVSPWKKGADLQNLNHLSRLFCFQSQSGSLSRRRIRCSQLIKWGKLILAPRLAWI